MKVACFLSEGEVEGRRTQGKLVMKVLLRHPYFDASTHSFLQGWSQESGVT